MKHKSTNSRWFCPSNIPESKTPDVSVRVICGKSENHQTIESEMNSQGNSQIEAPREPERERYFLSYAGVDEWLSDRGGETDAR